MSRNSNAARQTDWLDEEYLEEEEYYQAETPAEEEGEDIYAEDEASYDDHAVVYSEMMIPKVSSKVKSVFATALMVVFTAAFSIFCFVKVSLLREEVKALDEQIASLEADLEEEKATKMLLELEGAFSKSTQYIIQDARNRCRLVFPGDVIVDVNLPEK